MTYSRQAVVSLAQHWIGKNEADGSHKEIIDIYNSYGKLPRSTRMLYNWAWCACTWSAIAIKMGYTDIMPIEISCSQMIVRAKEMGCWQENDSYIPLPGDGILYDWQDTGLGDNKGNPDHMGIVEYVKDGYIVAIEGNKNDAVRRTTISINGKYIRGFITPEYDDDAVTEPVHEISGSKTVDQLAHEVITGLWGSGAARKNALEEVGYNYRDVQNRVNEILNGDAVKPLTPVQNQAQPTKSKCFATAYAHLKDESVAGTYKVQSSDGFAYCRNDAGTNKKALCEIPNGTRVKCYGFYNEYNEAKWLYISFTMDGIRYKGFTHSNLLKRMN